MSIGLLIITHNDIGRALLRTAAVLAPGSEAVKERLQVERRPANEQRLAAARDLNAWRAR